MNTEDRLRGFLHAKGNEIADSVDHESIQPEQRRRPSWLIAFAAAAAVLLVIGGIGLFARSGDGPVVDEAADTTTTIPATAAAVAAGPTLSWTEVAGPGVGDGYVSAIFTVDGGFIALTESWDPATETPSQQAWQSNDGTEWAPVELSGFEGAQVFAHTIAQGGPGFVAVGMEFEEPAASYGPNEGTFLAWTSMNGLDWQAHALPQPDLTAPDPLVTWYPSVETIAVSDAGIVAAGTAHAEVMFEQIVADHLGISLDEAMEQICGMGTNNETLEVFSCPENPEDSFYEEELLFSATFAELGISEEAASVMNEMSEQGLVWYSPDGTSWELLDDPFGGPAFISSVAATDDGFYAVAHGPMRPAVWHSANGRTWQASGATPENGDIDSIFAREGVLYATGWSRSGDASLWSSTDGATWAEIELNALFAGEEGQHSIWELQGGGLGLIGQAESYVDPFVDAEPMVLEADGLEISVWLGEGERVRIVDLATGEVLLEGGPWEYREPEPFELERDGYRVAMDIVSMSATVTDLATGEVVLEIDEPNGYAEPEGLRFDGEGGYVFYDPATDEAFLTVGWEEIDELLGLSPPYVRWDEDGIHYVDPETGEEIVNLPMEDYERAMDEAYRATEGAYEEPNMALVFSPDGTAWSRQSVAEAFGEAGWIESVTVGDDVVITVFRPHGENLPQNEAEAEPYEPPPAEWWLGTLDS
jgi:hypothetical protein